MLEKQFVTERQNYILKGELAQGCAVLYKQQEVQRLKELEVKQQIKLFKFRKLIQSYFNKWN